MHSSVSITYLAISHHGVLSSYLRHFCRLPSLTDIRSLFWSFDDDSGIGFKQSSCTAIASRCSKCLGFMAIDNSKSTMDNQNCSQLSFFIDGCLLRLSYQCLCVAKQVIFGTNLIQNIGKGKNNYKGVTIATCSHLNSQI